LVTLFGRVLDASGVEIADPALEVLSIAGGGSFSSFEVVHPKTGLFGMQLRLGSAGQNVFRLKAGDAVRTVTIVAE
jgi:hypothetical protein